MNGAVMVFGTAAGVLLLPFISCWWNHWTHTMFKQSTSRPRTSYFISQSQFQNSACRNNTYIRTSVNKNHLRRIAYHQRFRHLIVEQLVWQRLCLQTQPQPLPTIDRYDHMQGHNEELHQNWEKPSTNGSMEINAMLLLLRHRQTYLTYPHVFGIRSGI
jgi:hypothetical protein